VVRLLDALPLTVRSRSGVRVSVTRCSAWLARVDATPPPDHRAASDEFSSRFARPCYAKAAPRTAFLSGYRFRRTS
jgi:hypothetical protein